MSVSDYNVSFRAEIQDESRLDRNRNNGTFVFKSLSFSRLPLGSKKWSANNRLVHRCCFVRCVETPVEKIVQFASVATSTCLLRPLLRSQNKISSLNLHSFRLKKLNDRANASSEPTPGKRRTT
ncbi:uncharacterized protein LOC143146267 [Ptiloglossa arizonensis]|uniref:uncharacterized protein LOC143146267 n=1 Tax=Ptiloglossa arizonensis TaxID=3350558 RepID=UPI003FA09CC5